MKLLDVNVLVYAHHREAPQHEQYAAWLSALVQSRETFGMSDAVISGFLRVVTHPKIYRPPSSLQDALAFAQQLRRRPNFVPAAPGPHHWTLFVNLLQAHGLTGNDVTDAYHAALALEHNWVWISADKGFARFPGLKWRRPLS